MITKDGFHLPKRLELQYQQAIKKIVAKAIPVKLPEETWEQWVKRLEEMSQTADVQEAADHVAGAMTRWVNVLNAKSWREAAQRATRSRFLQGILERDMSKTPLGARVRGIVRENSELIKSLPLDAARQLTAEILKAQQAGIRPETMRKMMRMRFPELLKSRIALIARTETQKASAALTRARSEEVGADWYIWATSKDQRTRMSHKKMQGVLVQWSDPPSPEALIGENSTLGHYHAGECPNCRCTQIIVLTLSDVVFPARVYWHGSIKMMTKTQFKALTGIESIAA